MSSKAVKKAIAILADISEQVEFPEEHADAWYEEISIVLRALAAEFPEEEREISELDWGSMLAFIRS